jgi:hypothetical protein
MKFLIGILILLFVLTTIGFSGIAYAMECANVFYSRVESPMEQESHTGWNEFGLYRMPQYLDSSHYTPNTPNENNWNEFQSPRSENEFYYSETF